VTLKELMGDLEKGDGRRFTRAGWEVWFEPIFLGQSTWCGKYQHGRPTSWHEETIGWEEYVEPEKEVNMTLKELMGDKIRGEGRRFSLAKRSGWFEPIFFAKGIWCGKDHDGLSVSWCETTYHWKEYVEPKKKIEMWKWAHRNHLGKWAETNYYYATPPECAADMVRIEGSKIEVEE